MTEPTDAEIERVSVALAVSELRRANTPEAMIDIAERLARDCAVRAWGDLARAAIIAIREPDQ